MPEIPTDTASPFAAHDPGGKVRIPLKDGIVGEARFSPCGVYRQMIGRDWTPTGVAPRTILFLGMNPSTADAMVDDPTVNREQGFARRWNFTRYLKGNMLDFRSTNPKDLPHDPARAASSANLPAILDMAREAEQVVLAYGRLHKRYHDIVRATLNALVDTNRPLLCLGINADGSAKHPLYLASTTEPRPFEIPSALRPDTRR